MLSALPGVLDVGPPSSSQLLAVPQLDALDYEGILDVYQHVKGLFAAAPAEQRLILHRIEVLYPHITDWEPRGG